MNHPEWIALDAQDTFQFDCNRAVPCYNHCCRDLNQALTPYDVLRLRGHLQLSWEQFLERYAEVRTGPATGLPVVSLRFSKDLKQRCPFVAEIGCAVYTARPTSCRLYPLARMVRRDPADGRLREHYAVLKETHCRGFEQAVRRTAGQWIREQEAAEGLAASDRLMEIISLKNRFRPGPLSPTHHAWVRMAFYDLDRLKQEAAAGRLFIPNCASVTTLPDLDEDTAWLDWGLKWLLSSLNFHL
jgi:uncharacterized protein